MSRENVVWLSTSATTFSCLCELCLSTSEVEGTSFLEAIRDASVRGTFAADADVLLTVGVDYGQGWYYGRPGSAADLPPAAAVPVGGLRHSTARPT